MNEQSVELSDEDCHYNDSDTELFNFDETCDQNKGSANLDDPIIVNWVEFENWLLSADGGRASRKLAKQHRVQVRLLRNTTSRTVSHLWNKKQLRHFVEN